MNDELALRLYNRTLELKDVELNDIQSTKFKYACEKSIIENPTLDFQNLLIATKFYLDTILDFPNCEL